jgi:hypothetical protein
MWHRIDAIDDEHNKDRCDIEGVSHCCWKVFFKKFEFFFLFRSNMFLMFLNYFDVLISKIIFKK